MFEIKEDAEIIIIDRGMLIELCKGTLPYYNVFEDSLIKNSGKWSESYGTWTWNFDFEENLSNEELKYIYKICKDSWKNRNK